MEPVLSSRAWFKWVDVYSIYSYLKDIVGQGEEKININYSVWYQVFDKSGVLYMFLCALKSLWGTFSFYFMLHVYIIEFFIVTVI